MALVVDASVALKWVLEEESASQARDLLRRGDLYAPDFVMLECASTLSRQVRRRTIDGRRAEIALEEIRAAPVRLAPTLPLLPLAQQLSLQLNAATYDCLYLALALGEDAVVVTADMRFVNAAASNSKYAPHIRSL